MIRSGRPILVYTSSKFGKSHNQNSLIEAIRLQIGYERANSSGKLLHKTRMERTLRRMGVKSSQIQVIDARSKTTSNESGRRRQIAREAVPGRIFY